MIKPSPFLPSILFPPPSYPLSWQPLTPLPLSSVLSSPSAFPLNLFPVLCFLEYDGLCFLLHALFEQISEQHSGQIPLPKGRNDNNNGLSFVLFTIAHSDSGSDCCARWNAHKHTLLLLFERLFGSDECVCVCVCVCVYVCMCTWNMTWHSMS